MRINSTTLKRILRPSTRRSILGSARNHTISSTKCLPLNAGQAWLISFQKTKIRMLSTMTDYDTRAKARDEHILEVQTQEKDEQEESVEKPRRLKDVSHIEYFNLSVVFTANFMNQSDCITHSQLTP
jgi:hypothetical protein